MDKSMLGDLDSLPEEDKLRMSGMIDQLQIRDSGPIYHRHGNKGMCTIALVGGDDSVFSHERDSIPDWSGSNCRGSQDSDQSTLCMVKPVITHSTSYPSCSVSTNIYSPLIHSD